MPGGPRLRCGLYHEAGDLPANLQFIEEQRISTADGPHGVLQLPASFVGGLIVAVVASPVNKGLNSPGNYHFGFRGFQAPVNAVWGKRDAVLSLFHAMNAFSS